MKINYDKEIDAKYVTLKEGKVHETQALTEWLMLDLDAEGEVLGVEILDASKNLVSLQTEDNRLQQITEMESTTSSVDEKIGNITTSESPILRNAFKAMMAA